jgi:hypothetical protein
MELSHEDTKRPMAETMRLRCTCRGGMILPLCEPKTTDIQGHRKVVTTKLEKRREVLRNGRSDLSEMDESSMLTRLLQHYYPSGEPMPDADIVSECAAHVYVMFRSAHVIWILIQLSHVESLVLTRPQQQSRTSSGRSLADLILRLGCSLNWMFSYRTVTSYQTCKSFRISRT